MLKFQHLTLKSTYHLHSLINLFNWPLFFNIRWFFCFLNHNAYSFLEGISLFGFSVLSSYGIHQFSELLSCLFLFIFFYFVLVNGYSCNICFSKRVVGPQLNNGWVILVIRILFFLYLILSFDRLYLFLNLLLWIILTPLWSFYYVIWLLFFFNKSKISLNFIFDSFSFFKCCSIWTTFRCCCVKTCR